MANEANFLFPDCSLFTIKNQIIFKTCLCKRSISHHSSLHCIFFPLVHPFASSVPQRAPSKNIHEKWQYCIFCLTSVKPDPVFCLTSVKPDFQYRGSWPYKSKVLWREPWVIGPAKVLHTQLRGQFYLGWLSPIVKTGYVQTIKEEFKPFSKNQDKYPI